MQLYFIHFYLFYRYAFKQHQLLPYSKYLLYRFTLFLFFNTHPCTLFISSKNQLGVETGADSEQRIPTVRVLGKKHQGVHMPRSAPLASDPGFHQAALKEDPQITLVPDQARTSNAFCCLWSAL